MAEVDTHDDAAAHSSSAVSALAPQLFVVLECDRPLSGSSRHALGSVDEVVIGRGEKRDVARELEDGVRRLVVRVPGRSMLTRHGRIVPSGAQWVLEDWGSTNGTFQNGERVERAVLIDGDVLELGHTLFVFRAAMPVAQGAPADVDSSSLDGHLPGLSTLHPARAVELAALERIAASALSVVLTGESGTGKEILATAIHTLSRRRGRLVAVNCGALTGSLVESQLFGHVKGAFSGAIRDEIGLVRAADGGTLFLDEIGDLAPASQAALLRVLQEGEVLPVGGNRPVKVDLRVVSATHRPLRAMVERGEFRADLLARLDGFMHSVPPLRRRSEDLGLLIATILPRVMPGASAPALSVEAARALFQYPWTANVRELRQCLARAAVLAGGARIDLAHLPPGVADALRKPAGSPAPREIDEFDEAGLRRELILLLERHEGNVSQVAREMGKARMQIHRWMKRFGIDGESFRKA